MRLLVYILTTGILLFNLQLRGQEINSYNVNAILDVDNKSIEVKQIMKFRNTSNIELNEIFLEDWSNSYINNETKLAKRISDEYSRSFSFAQKRQRGFTTINDLKGENIKSWYRCNTQLDIIKVELSESIKKDQFMTIELNYSILWIEIFNYLRFFLKNCSHYNIIYSTVTDFAKFLGLSISQFLSKAT